MPWKQPDSSGPNGGPGGGDDRDPWSRRQRRNAPPDLDEIFRELKNRVEALLGGRRGGGGRGDDGGDGRGLGLPGGGMLGLIALVVVGLWLFSGVYTVDQGEQAIELRFGKYQETKDAGLHWHIPAPIEEVEIINTQTVNTVEVGYRKGASTLTSVPREALMLTQDENIIDVQFAVQYDIKDPTDLLFNVSEFTQRSMAETTVRQATESAVREIVGRSTMDFAITEGRAQLAAETKSLVQRILDRYKTGINVRTVEMQNAQPPQQVKNAFDDVVRAREDEERIKNLAQAYANDIIPKARGFAARILQEAEAYREATVAQAEGEAARFEQVLAEYAKAPAVTRDRLYLEAMEQVLGNSSKMMIDQKSGNSVMYLPLDQLLRNRAEAVARGLPQESGAGAVPPSAIDGFNTTGRASDRNNTRNSRSGSN
ncbi:MAG: FtsH protease activity modulator HflK [Gammaproteobacteria bacterium]|nr:FtsH protease activity modulator HflK [Gammaproteobacteria bacterium]